MGGLLVTLAADATELEAGLAEATEATEASTGKMKGLFDSAEKAIGKSMKDAAKHVTEAVGEMVKKFVDAGMGANAAAESIGAAFDKLTGGKLKIEAIIEATNKVKDFTLSLKNLSQTVPLTFGKVIELKDALEHLHISSEHMPKVLQELEKNISKVAKGDADAAKKFHELGIATDGWKDKAPAADAILVKLSENIKNAHDPLLAMNQAMEVAGDDLLEMMPLLRQGGAAVKAQAESHVANALAIEHSADAFQHLHATESNLAEVMQNLLVPIFRVLAQVLDIILQGITKLIEWTTRFGHVAVAVNQLVGDAFKALGKIIIDIFRPIFGWLKEGLEMVMGKLRELGGWFESIARIGLAALGKVKDFILDQLAPVFRKIGEGVDWVVQKFNALKEWIGRIKDAIFEMARPVIETFQHIAKVIGDFFRLHWGDVAKDAREAAGILAADTQKVLDAAMGRTPVDSDHQFGGELPAYVEQSEQKKTDAVKRGTKAREVITLQSRQSIIHIAKDADDKEIVDWHQTMEAIGRDTQAENKVIGDILKGMPAPMVPALQKAASKTMQIWQSVSHNMATAFSSAIRGMIDGTQTLGQAFAKMGQQMLSNLESVLEKMLSQWLEHHLMELFIHMQTKQGEIGVDKAASAEKQEISMKDHIKEVFMAAKQAAVNAWKALSGIPVVGPALGAAAASATFAAVMAFGSLTSAAGGFYEVDRDQLALIHKKEMVLPASIAERLRSNLASGTDSSAPDLHVHVYSNVNAIDSASFKDTIKQHSNMIGNEVARVLKKRNLATSS